MKFKLLLTHLFILLFALTISNSAKSQNQCGGYTIKLKDGSIEKWTGPNRQGTWGRDIVDFDCNDKKIAVVKKDGTIQFCDYVGNVQFSCNPPSPKPVKIKLLDNSTYVITRIDGTMRKYEGCNDRGNF